MYASELRACGLGAVVCVLLGLGIGFGWHYVDNGGGRAAVGATAPPVARQDAPGPPPNPPRSQLGAVLDGLLFPGLSRYPQPIHSY